MNWLCKLFGCKQKDCTEEIVRAVKECQDDCNRIIREREIRLMEETTKLQEELSLEILARESWRRKYNDCMKNKPSKAIKSLEVRDGKFLVNGKATKLYGVSKREMIAVGSGDCTNVNYKYADIKKAILNSNINYIRVLAGKNLDYFRKEVKDYLEHGIVVEVELFDAGNPGRGYQADWLKTFDNLKDLPVFFDSCNEFLDYNLVDVIIGIVDHVRGNGGIVSAGAWSGERGKKLAKEFRSKCNTYQVVSHHREWDQKSLLESVEAGKPIIMNEIHTRDIDLPLAKTFFNNAFTWGCQGVNIYPLKNWGMGKDSNFQKILDWVSEFVDKED